VRAVGDYDPMLRVRWCPEVQEISVEREAHATEREVMRQLRAILWGRANRPISPKLSLEKQRFMVTRRNRAKVELGAALLNRRHIFLVPDTTTFFLRCTLHTLHETDCWNHPGVQDEGFHQGRLDQAAARIARDGEWHETYERRGRMAAYDRENRDKAKEAYRDMQFLDGAVSGAPIRNRRYLNSQTWRP
jgi:hypothetical protein